MTEPNWKIATKRLYFLTNYYRWLLILFCWLTFGVYAFWQLKEDFFLWTQYFTWVAVRYALIFNPIATVCLSFCLVATLTLLAEQFLDLFFGLSDDEQEKLLKRAKKIYFKGTNHPFYNWIYQLKK
jgi:hypothetical protein